MSGKPGPAGRGVAEDIQDGTMHRGKSPVPGHHGSHAHKRTPLEYPPMLAFLNMAGVLVYRPADEEVSSWHTVAKGRHETWWTVAAKYQVPVEKLIEFNFPGSVIKGRVNPAIVNWFLHHHKGFGCPETYDHVNRKFQGGERVAIPFLGRVDVGEARIGKPPSLKEPGEILVSEKFTYEFSIPRQELDPAELGYFLARAKIAVEGEIKKEKGFAKVAWKKDQVKLGIEHKFEEDLKGTFSIKGDQKTLDTIAKSVKEGGKWGFFKAIAAPFEVSLKEKYHVTEGVNVVPEVGLEVSKTPVAIRLSGEYEGPIEIPGRRIEGKFVFKIGFNVGLSKKGWAWVVERVGPEAIKRLIASAGESLAGLWEYLVAEGIVAAGVIVIGTVVGTFALTALMAWVVADAKRKGRLEGLSYWYVTAFARKVFGEERPSGYVFPEDAEDRDTLIELGEKDAINQARSVLRKSGRPEADGSDDEALQAYKNILLDLDGDDYRKAKWRLERSLEETRKKLAQE